MASIQRLGFFCRVNIAFMRCSREFSTIDTPRGTNLMEIVYEPIMHASPIRKAREYNIGRSGVKVI